MPADLHGRIFGTYSPGEDPAIVTGLSDRDPQHKLPVVEQLEAALYTDALVTLAATRTFPVK
jgi:hypothetical protein